MFDNTPVRRLTLVAGIDTFTGYGQHAIALIRGLTKLGIHVSVRPLFIRTDYGTTIPNDIRERFVNGPQPEQWELLLTRPNSLPSPGKRTVYYTMFEATRLDPKWVRMLNMAEVVLVPSNWNASTFSASGVDVPIRVVPLGLDPKVFFNRPPEPNDKIVFGTGGRLSEGSKERKGIQDIIDAFRAAFPPEQQNVRLNIKLFPDCPFEAPPDERISVKKILFSDKGLADWYARLSVFVSASRCEGWGLMEQQACAIGRPIITSGFGGISEWLIMPLSYEYKHVRATGVYSGKGNWVEPDFGSLTRILKAFPDYAATSASCSDEISAQAMPYTWERSVATLVEVLEEFGVIKGVESTRAEIAQSPAESPYGVMVYLPPRHIGHADVFIANFGENPPGCPWRLLTDDPSGLQEHDRIEPPTTWFNNSDNIASYVFIQAIRYARDLGWEYLIWLESDCRVCGKDWAKRLMTEVGTDRTMIAAGNLATNGVSRMTAEAKREMNSLAVRYPVFRADGPTARVSILHHYDAAPRFVPFVNGAPAVYHVANTLKLLGDREPQEIVKSVLKIQDLDLGNLAVDEFGEVGALKRMRHLPSIMATGGTVGESTYSFQTRIKALRDGTCVAVHPIKNRWRPPPADGYRFYHSGCLGDLIYALKAISLAGGGHLLLGSESTSKVGPVRPFTPELYGMLEPFLRRQNYLTSIRWGNPRDATHDLSMFHDYWTERRNLRIPIENLAEMYCYVIGVERLFNPEPWLVAVKSCTAPEIIVHRSPRVHADRSSPFPWKEILLRFAAKMVFVGLPEEYDAFVQEFKVKIPLWIAPTFDSMAMMINGAKWFIGNSSLPCAIAIGLGKNVYQEAFYSDCLFQRANFHTQADPVDVITL